MTFYIVLAIGPALTLLLVINAKIKKTEAELDNKLAKTREELFISLIEVEIELEEKLSKVFK